MHSAVVKNLEEYIVPNPNLGLMLEQLKGTGKQLFLLTNSKFSYINPGMQFLLGKDWKDYFDLVLVSGNKPNFFTLDNVSRFEVRGQ